MSKMNKAQLGAKIGFVSRLEYGSEGFRQATIDAGFDIFRQEGTHFNALVAGLIAHKTISKKMQSYVKESLYQDKLQKRKFPELDSLPPHERAKARKMQLENGFLMNIAKDLAKIIPQLTVANPEDPKKEKLVDLFIMTSPAFDGEIGETVAHFLSDLRPDIWLWHQGGDRLFVKYVDKIIWALAPEKAVWMRGDYYSTAVERVIKDKTKQTTQSSPDLFAVGGFGSSINKPQGELKYRYISLPALHRLEETRVSENQVGVRVLEYAPDGKSYLVRTYNLKDLVANELSFVASPPDATPVQKKIIEIMKARNWVTPGMLESELSVPAGQVIKEMRNLEKQKAFSKKGQSWPGVTFFETSKKYYFNLPWIQRKLRYVIPDGPWNEDNILSFACLHAGSIETDYEFFVNEVPKIILERNVTTLVGAGDFVEGLKHDLDRKGEIIAGMNNNTVQEMFSGHLVGSVIMPVFKQRFRELLAKDKDMTGEKLCKTVRKALLRFAKKAGNHDLWLTAEGHLALKVFQDTLVSFVIDSVKRILNENNLVCNSLEEIVREQLGGTEFFDLPSGLKVCVQHPHMSRTKTTSIRPQEMLDYAKRHGCQVSIGGNFHTSENVEEWDMDLGQCVSQMIGTIKHGSSFERNKMKIVDQGIGYLRILSKDKRIFMVESAFYGEPHPKPPIDNIDIINTFVKKIGVEPIKV